MREPTRSDRLAHLVEWRVLPLLFAFALGLLAGLHRTEQQELAAERAVGDALQQVHRARLALAQWRSACEPLLALPVEAAPLVIPAATAGEDERAAALHWGAPR